MAIFTRKRYVEFKCEANAEEKDTSWHACSAEENDSGSCLLKQFQNVFIQKYSKTIIFYWIEDVLKHKKLFHS